MGAEIILWVKGGMVEDGHCMMSAMLRPRAVRAAGGRFPYGQADEGDGFRDRLPGVQDRRLNLDWLNNGPGKGLRCEANPAPLQVLNEIVRPRAANSTLTTKETSIRSPLKPFPATLAASTFWDKT